MHDSTLSLNSSPVHAQTGNDYKQNVSGFFISLCFPKTLALKCTTPRKTGNAGIVVEVHTTGMI